MADEGEADPDLRQKVRKWLDHTGHPLEFRAAHALHAAGFCVTQGLYVPGEDPDRPREIDVVASVRPKSDLISLSCHLVVECKSSRDKPWVVFTRRSLVEVGQRAILAFSSGPIQAKLFGLARTGKLSGLTTFSRPHRIGFAGRQVFSKSDDKDIFYGAVQSVVAKTRSLYVEWCQRNGGIDEPTGAFFLPVVVVDGRVFEAYFDDAACDLVVEEVKRVRLHWAGAIARKSTAIDVVAESAFPDFVAQCRSDFLEVARMARRA